MVNAKKALSRLWEDRCSIAEYQEISNPNGSTGFEEVTVLEDLPCRLSYSTLQAASQNDDDAQIVQATKLFLDGAVRIKPGSKITVQRYGQTFEYCQSGEPGVYASHQEITLAPFAGYA